MYDSRVNALRFYKSTILVEDQKCKDLDNVDTCSNTRKIVNSIKQSRESILYIRIIAPFGVEVGLYPRQQPMRRSPPHARQHHNLQTHPKDVARIPRINDPIIDHHRTRRVALRVPGHLVPEPLHPLLQLLRLQRLPFRDQKGS